MSTSEAQREAVKRWRQRNPEKVREWSAAWRDKNRDHVTLYNKYYGRKRRARLKRLAKKKNGK